MTALTLIRNRRGDFETHVAGCSEIKRNADNDFHSPTYSGEDLAGAIRSADADMAAWFCEEPYTESAAENGCWTVSQTKIAPCLAKALRAAHLTVTRTGPALEPGDWMLA